MEFVIKKDDIVGMAKKLRINSAADGDSFLVFWDDDRFGVVSRRDLVNIAVSELTDDVHGKKCEAMYGEEKYYVTLMFRGRDEDQLYRLADKCDGIWRQNKKSMPQTKKRISKSKSFTDFELDNIDLASTSTEAKGRAKGTATKKKKGEKNDAQKEVPAKKSKEELQKEKRERMRSRTAAMEEAEGWIAQHATNVSMEVEFNNNSSSSFNTPLVASLPQPNTPVSSSIISLPSQPNTPISSSIISLPSQPNTPISSSIISLPPQHNTLISSNNASLPPQPNTSVSSNIAPMPPMPNNPVSSNISFLPPQLNTSFNPLSYPFINNNSLVSPQYTPSPHGYPTNLFSSNKPVFDNHAYPVPLFPQFNSCPPNVVHPSGMPNLNNSLSNPDQISSTSSCMSSALRTLNSVENEDIEINVCDDTSSECHNVSSVECPLCIEKKMQIDSLNEALIQAQKDNEALLKRIKCLEEKGRETPDRLESEELKADHYLPSRGLQIDHSDYKIIPLDQETPTGYERMGGTEVVVPQKWLFTVLAKCKGKGPSFTVKKLIDGFFEPKDLKGQKASLLRSNKIIQAIRLFAINKFHIKDSEFNCALNSKIHTFARAFKREEGAVSK